jgi:hypothetical protein
MPRPLTGAVGRALVGLAAPDGPDEPGPVELVIDRGELASLSEHVFQNRLDAPFAEVLRRLGAPVPNGHLARISENRVSRMRAAAALVELTEILGGGQIEWVVVKGPVVARSMHHPEHRAYNDLDVVVTGPHFERALDALVAAGADELNRNWDAYVRYEVGEVPMRLRGAPLDLHWSLVGLGSVRRTMRMPTDQMVRRRMRVQVNGTTDVPVLEPVDRLLHLCVHTSLSGARRLDQLRDIAVEVRGEPSFDWDQFERRARSALVAPLVAHALDRAANVLGASIPHTTVERMGGVSLRIGRWIDATGAPGRNTVRGIHVKSARNEWSARASAWWRLIHHEVTRRGNPSHTWDFADPDSVLYQDLDAGGPDARRAFIDLAG